MDPLVRLVTGLMQPVAQAFTQNWLSHHDSIETPPSPTNQPWSADWDMQRRIETRHATVIERPPGFEAGFARH
jgi:hypothetical protein